MNYGNSAKTTLSVSLLARGLEVSSCPGSSLRLRSFDAAGAELPAQAMALVQTPSNGDFLSMSFAFSLDPVALIGGAYQLEVSTAYCGSNDYDDMEFVGVTASLN